MSTTATQPAFLDPSAAGVRRLTCSFERLVAAFGQPTKRYEKGTSDKLQVEWNIQVDLPHGSGWVNIYDYKEDVPAEQVMHWSIQFTPPYRSKNERGLDPKCADELVDRLNQAEPKTPVDPPDFLEILKADWMRPDNAKRTELSSRLEHSDWTAFAHIGSFIGLLDGEEILLFYVGSNELIGRLELTMSQSAV
jgi:hypothetical protein